MANRGDIDIRTVQPKLFSKWKKLNIEETLDKAGLFTKLKSSQYFGNGQFPVIDQGDKFISGYVNDEKLLYKGSLPVIIFGDHTRNIKFIDFPFAAGADGTKILKPLGIYNPKFYHYYLKSLQVPNLGYSRHFSILKEIEFPLPPLAEQNRIVAKLDSLFAQLESIKTSMAKIPVLLKNFRQQVLTQAVTGKLTKEWRENNKLKKWKYELAKDCCEKVQSGGTPKGSKFEDSGIPFLKVYNIVNNKINFEYNPQYVSEEIQNSQIKKSITYPGDIVMNIVGPPLNKIAIIPNDYAEWNLNQAITLFRVKEYVINKFLYFFFCEGSSVKSLINETKGVVGQINISLSQCRDFLIPIPSFQEQEEIVSRVESLFAKADRIEEKYKKLKGKIEILPQTILYKAFKGELTEQLETDDDARDLLEQIVALKSEGKKK